MKLAKLERILMMLEIRNKETCQQELVRMENMEKIFTSRIRRTQRMMKQDSLCWSQWIKTKTTTIATPKKITPIETPKRTTPAAVQSPANNQHHNQKRRK
uniref:Uncharacterized protein n=1 Tax=Cacopsylla melanoneura TaxID=428564 RepID=A0A8D8WVN7_9HEMI